jgi:lipopolysaccharide/colanic/teichoic acid biosynthesis glycosyltransferase/glycosyltransferase involved in cell wall biosynthesis
MEIASPRISVVVPAYNSENTISCCLNGLLNQTIPRDQYEIIVVDDASKDNTRAVVQTYPDIRLVTIPHGGPAAGRNAGAKLAAGEILAFTDSDCVPTPDWLRCLTSPFEDAEIVGVKGAYRTLQSEIVARFVQLEYESKYRRMKQRSYIDFIDTYSAAYRKDVFLQNNGFDTSFPVASVEDQEFSFRLASKGYRMVFAPSAIVHHQHDRSLGEYIRRKFNIGLWKGYMLYWLPEKTFEDSHTLPSQRWQILLLGIGLIFLVLSLFQPWALWISAASLVLSLVTAIPFLYFIFQQDLGLLLPSLVLLLARSSALGSGLLAGFAYLPLVKPHQKKQGLTMFERIVKRLADILISLIGLILFLPFFPLVALAIKLDSPGPVLFFQVRAGENGKPFSMIKFRTMVDNAEKILFTLINPDELEEPVYKIPQDPRITRVGKFLRRWSLDEVPQLWNVLRGEMSLVGPRPEEVWLVARYNDAQRQRLVFKPGLTGPMQIAARGELCLSARLALELEYIQHYTLSEDLMILLKSIPAVIRGKGAF